MRGGLGHSERPEDHGKGSNLIPRSVFFQTIALLNAPSVPPSRESGRGPGALGMLGIHGSPPVLPFGILICAKSRADTEDRGRHVTVGDIVWPTCTLTLTSAARMAMGTGAVQTWCQFIVQSQALPPASNVMPEKTVHKHKERCLPSIQLRPAGDNPTASMSIRGAR